MAEITQWNADQLLEKARLISLAYVDHLDDKFRSQFSSVTYPWPNKTRRRNGETVESPRDIVDTSVLRESQTVQLNDNGGTFTWDPPEGYAAGVFTGRAYGTAAKARNWIKPVLDKEPFAVFFSREWQRAAAVRSGARVTY